MRLLTFSCQNCLYICDSYVTIHFVFTEKIGITKLLQICAVNLPQLVSEDKGGGGGGAML